MYSLHFSLTSVAAVLRYVNKTLRVFFRHLARLDLIEWNWDRPFFSSDVWPQKLENRTKMQKSLVTWPERTCELQFRRVTCYILIGRQVPKTSLHNAIHTITMPSWTLRSSSEDYSAVHIRMRCHNILSDDWRVQLYINFFPLDLARVLPWWWYGTWYHLKIRLHVPTQSTFLDCWWRVKKIQEQVVMYPTILLRTYTIGSLIEKQTFWGENKKPYCPAFPTWKKSFEIAECVSFRGLL